MPDTRAAGSGVENGARGGGGGDLERFLAVEH